jgi:hypothetical protein
MSTSRAQAPGGGSVPRDLNAAPADPDANPPGESGCPDADAQPDETAAARTSAALRGPAARRVGGHLLLIACYTAAGIAVTWPLTAILTGGKLLQVNDISSYVWALWWMAHQVSHVSDPWFTQYMAAPVGIDLGFNTLMPLPGFIMTPVTLLWGPVASFTVLTIITPGLLGYVTYRAARLWLGQAGAIAAGALFGLSTMVDWQNIYHLNISIGTLFLPLTLEAAIRLKRDPGRRQGIILGIVLAASVLTNQESAVLAALLTVAILLPWLIARIVRRDDGRPALTPVLRTLGLGAVVAVVLASPQLYAMIHQVMSGNTKIAPEYVNQLTDSYWQYRVGLPTLFAPSPQLVNYHLGHLASAYQFAEHTEGRPTFGVVLAALAVIGLALSWRRRPLRWMGLLWLVGAVLALGPRLTIGTKTYVPLATNWHGVRVSMLMPYTWLIRIPGLSALREADRLALLGLLGAVVLAGAAVQWLCDHVRPVVAVMALIVVAGAGSLEAGWQARGTSTIPSSMPGIDRVLSADHSNSIVVDVPFGLRGGVGVWGDKLWTQELVLATEDSHPRAISYTSWVPQSTINRFNAIPFYQHLYAAQNGARFTPDGPAVIASRRSARARRIEWVVVWHTRTRDARRTVIKYLYSAGFVPHYRANLDGFGVTVWQRHF